MGVFKMMAVAIGQLNSKQRSPGGVCFLMQAACSSRPWDRFRLTLAAGEA